MIYTLIKESIVDPVIGLYAIISIRTMHQDLGCFNVNDTTYFHIK